MANEYLNNKSFESVIINFQKLKRQKNRCDYLLKDIEEICNRRKKKYNDDKDTDKLEEIKSLKLKINNDHKICQDQLSNAFYLLAENIVNYTKFSGVDIDDAMQEIVMICLEKIDRFNPHFIGKTGQKSKAFNYFSTLSINTLRQSYRFSKNYHELKRKFSIYLKECVNNTTIPAIKIKKQFDDVFQNQE